MQTLVKRKPLLVDNCLCKWCSFCKLSWLRHTIQIGWWLYAICCISHVLHYLCIAVDFKYYAFRFLFSLLSYVSQEKKISFIAVYLYFVTVHTCHVLLTGKQQTSQKLCTLKCNFSKTSVLHTVWLLHVNFSILLCIWLLWEPVSMTGTGKYEFPVYIMNKRLVCCYCSSDLLRRLRLLFAFFSLFLIWFKLEMSSFSQVSFWWPLQCLLFTEK